MLADRLHNMRTLGYLSPERHAHVATETIEIYAPIAHRLGMGKVRGELEDLAFRRLDPEAFAEFTGGSRTRIAPGADFGGMLEELRATLSNGKPPEIGER
jgi:GTP pyrophosphokinase